MTLRKNVRDFLEYLKYRRDTLPPHAFEDDETEDVEGEEITLATQRLAIPPPSSDNKQPKSSTTTTYSGSGQSGTTKSGTTYTYTSTYNPSKPEGVTHLFSKKQIGHLHNSCQMRTQSIFRSYQRLAQSNPNIHCSKDDYVWVDNGGKVLMVAHMDTVFDQGREEAKSKRHSSRTFEDGQKWEDHGSWIVSPGHDDRLGWWIISHILPDMVNFQEMPYDILITRDEEVGQSTAYDANRDKPWGDRKYHFMVEFDRRGTDVPMYTFRNTESTQLLSEYGFEIGNGSFTDICALKSVGCVGFNFGCCYYQAHTTNCWADMNQLWEQLEKFVKFYHGEYDNHMPYTKSAALTRSYRTGDGWWDDYYDYGYYGNSRRNTQYCTVCSKTTSTVYVGYQAWCSECYKREKKEEGKTTNNQPSKPTQVTVLPKGHVNCSCCAADVPMAVAYLVRTTFDDTTSYMCSTCYYKEVVEWNRDDYYHCSICDVIIFDDGIGDTGLCYNCQVKFGKYKEEE